jgi:hypothetical protein
MTDTTLATDRPDVDADYRCPYCERSFHADRLRTLHKGLDHPDRIDDDERTAFRETYRSEGQEIREFRLKVIGGLVLLYFLTLFAYIIVT